ncbi:MAG: ABC transporter permease [Gammaproteobacteria bacterium]|nr:ABC transporter permease [Gammaproteobacteria bacterium]
MTAPLPHKDRPYRRQIDGIETTMIRPQRGLSLANLAELWRFRELALVMVERDIRVRYRQTVMGVSWAIAQPIVMMVVFSIVFGRLAKVPSEGFPYPVFVYAGLLPWLLFANAVSHASNALVAQSQLVSKIYFPRLLLPLSAVGVWLMDFVIAAFVLMALMLYYGTPFSLGLLLLAPLLAGVLLAALGVGVFFSALIVSYRDFRYVVPFVIQIWMFATPVIYPLAMIPTEWQWLMHLNPMAGFVDGFRAAFLGKPLNLGALAVAAFVAALMFLVGAVYFQRAERRFADVI